MSKNIPTLPQILHDIGYETVNYGTWHISADPREYGVDISDKSQPSCEKTTEKGISYLENFSNQKPFFLRIGFHEPHLPFTDNYPHLNEFKNVDIPHYLTDHPQVREQLSMFYGDISRVDACVSRLMQCLQNLSLDKETIIIFTSDHGPGLPFAKCTLYDPGIKIPWIIKWEEKIEGNRRFEGLTSNADFMPTLLEIIGEKSKTSASTDGLSIAPYLTGNEKIKRECVFAEQTWHDFYEPLRAIRTKRYKLIRNLIPGRGLQVGADIRISPCGEIMAEALSRHSRPEYELYDLSEDPQERNNLIGTERYASTEKELKDKLNNWLSETSDPILKGTVKAPAGYWEHFWAKPEGPGGFAEKKNENCFTVKWSGCSVNHKCVK
jgi:arylsulfatase A-like enzyme